MGLALLALVCRLLGRNPTSSLSNFFLFCHCVSASLKVVSSGFVDFWCKDSSFVCFMIFSPFESEICSFRGFLDVDSLILEIGKKLSRVRVIVASVYPINVSRNILLGA